MILWSSGQSVLELNLLPLRMTSFSGGKHTSNSGTVVKSRDSWNEEQDGNFKLILSVNISNISDTFSKTLYLLVSKSGWKIYIIIDYKQLQYCVNDIWNKSFMNCGNEMKVKKWSSQWTQLRKLRSLWRSLIFFTFSYSTTS